MTETYDFPDSEDIPKIQTTTEEKYDRPESKRLFIQYNSDEWESEEDAIDVLQTINSLFGTEVQVAIIPKDFDLLSNDEVEQLVEDVLDGDS